MPEADLAMPSGDLDVVRANNAAFSARDVDGMLRCYAPDAVVEDRRRVGFGSFRGHDELRAYYRGIVDSACELHEDLEVLAAAGGVVAAHCRLRGRLASDPTGPEVGAEYGLVLRIEDGLIARLDVCEDGDHALELSGVSRA
jgi:ketosteroid isomerase-like protein